MTAAESSLQPHSARDPARVPRRSWFGLRARIMLLSCALSFLAAVFMGGIAYLRSAEIALEMSKTALRAETTIMARRLGGKVSVVGDDVLLISGSPTIPIVLGSRQSGGADTPSDRTLEANRDRLSRFLGSIIQARSAYISITLVNFSGEQIVSVARANGGRDVKVNHRLRFQEDTNGPLPELSHLRPGEVRVASHVHGTDRHLAFATSIALADGSDALLSVVVDADTLMSPILDERINRKSVLVVKSGAQPELLLGQALPIDQRLQATIEEAIAGEHSNGKPDALAAPAIDDQLFVSAAPSPPWLVGDRFVVALGVDRETLIAPAVAAQRKTLVMVALLFALTLVVGAAVAGLITRPLVKLTSNIMSARTIRDLSRLPLARGDEIGELSRAFQGLTDRLVAAESRSHEVLQAVEDGVVTFGANGRIETVNPAARAMFPDLTTGAPITKLLKNIPVGDLVPSGEGTHSLTLESGSGRTRHVEIVCALSSLNDRGFATAVIRDVTEQKATAEAKEQFISTISHELRTPLTAIKSALLLLQHKISSTIGAKDLHLLSLALSNTHRLARLVDDILSVERSISGELEYHFEKIELNAFVEEVLSDQSALAHAHSVTFNLDASDQPISADIDPARLEQVIINLLSNAGKFSPPHEMVNVSIRQFGENDVRITVSDRGPGIAPKFVNKIFQRFASDSNKASAVQAGTGLGLNIAKTMVSAMGGKIDFDTVVDEGTQFHIDFPVSM